MSGGTAGFRKKEYAPANIDFSLSDRLPEEIIIALIILSVG
jgi:hypothetical protein